MTKEKRNDKKKKGMTSPKRDSPAGQTALEKILLLTLSFLGEIAASLSLLSMTDKKTAKFVIASEARGIPSGEGNLAKPIKR